MLTISALLSYTDTEKMLTLLNGNMLLLHLHFSIIPPCR